MVRDGAGVGRDGVVMGTDNKESHREGHIEGHKRVT